MGSYYTIGAISGQNGGGSLDDYIFSVRLEGENARRHTFITPGGSTKLSTTESVHGGSSLCVTGLSQSHVETIPASTTEFPNGTADFTYQFWVKHHAGDGTRRGMCGQLASSGATATANVWIEMNTSNKVFVYLVYGAAVLNLSSTTSITVAGGWAHVALVRDGSTFRLYINGVQEDSVTNGVTINSANYKFSIGRVGEYPSLYTPAYFDLFQVDNGVCRYPGGTTFTAPSTPPTPDLYTVFQANFVGSDLSNRFVDSAKAAYAGTGPASAVIDMSGNGFDFVQTAVNARPTFNSADDTIAFNGATSILQSPTVDLLQTFTMYSKANVGASAGSQRMFGSSTTVAYMGLTAAEYFEANAGANVADAVDHSGLWKTFAVGFSGATSKLYVDGVLVASGDLGTNKITSLAWGGLGGIYANMTSKNAFVTPRAYESNLNSLVMAT